MLALLLSFWFPNNPTSDYSFICPPMHSYPIPSPTFHPMDLYTRIRPSFDTKQTFMATKQSPFRKKVISAAKAKALSKSIQRTFLMTSKNPERSLLLSPLHLHVPSTSTKTFLFFFHHILPYHPLPRTFNHSILPPSQFSSYTIYQFFS